ncbi:cytochrome P450 [Phyllosticta citrichinensis]|uniref:Cytochrome P450 n=1 Tax=Phyllosticta citrichinensis TaxID=1130410 RepID=A0ABR1Y157_9PEZI
MTTAIGLVFYAALALILWRLSRIGRRPPGYPPGPPTLPLIGNLHQMPAKNQHEQFLVWSRQYGPVFSLILGTQVLIVLSSAEAAKDLLDKRSAMYSDRPDSYVGQTIGSGGLRLLMLPYGQDWRMIRKLSHQLLNANASRTYVPYQDLESKQMLVDLLDKPSNFIEHIRRYTASVTTSIVFGWRVPRFDEIRLTRFYAGLDAYVHLVQSLSAGLLDCYPLLRQLPSSLFPAVRSAAALHVKEKALYRSHWLSAKAQAAAGTLPPCFCAALSSTQHALGLSDDFAAYIAGTLLEAGADTTGNTLMAFVMAMLLHPEAQARAQAELDAVVGLGASRLPTMEDAERCPYTRACVKEALRWFPTAILGAMPHAASRDDVYSGFAIPKGAAVTLNVWALNMDAARYTTTAHSSESSPGGDIHDEDATATTAIDPSLFAPERYLARREWADASVAELATAADADVRDAWVFGAGRRLCPGVHVAERSLFLGIARMLWAFDVEAPPAESAGEGRGKGGKRLPNPRNMINGLVVMPEPFEAVFRVRGQGREEVVRREWESVRGTFLDPEEQWCAVPEGMAVPRGL